MCDRKLKHYKNSDARMALLIVKFGEGTYSLVSNKRVGPNKRALLIYLVNHKTSRVAFLVSYMKIKSRVEQKYDELKDSSLLRKHKVISLLGKGVSFWWVKII